MTFEYVNVQTQISGNENEPPKDPDNTVAIVCFMNLHPYTKEVDSQQDTNLESVATHYVEETFKNLKTGHPSSGSQDS